MNTMRPQIRAILIDLSGTLHVGSTPIANAVSALQSLRQSNVPFKLCTNTSKESTSDLRNRLTGMGFDVKPDSTELWTSIGALSQFISARGLKRPLFLLSESALKECSDLAIQSSDVPYDSVVVGLAPDLLDYSHLNDAFRVLIKEQSEKSSGDSMRPPSLIATSKAKFIRSPDGELSLGPGAFVAALETASGCQAEVVGKPNREFFETVLRSFRDEGVCVDTQGSSGKIAIIGDDVQADLGGGAIELGLWRVLVRTGKYRSGDEHRPGIEPPDEVHDSFAAFVESILTASPPSCT